AVFFDRPLNDLDRPLDPGAKAAGLRQHYPHHPASLPLRPALRPKSRGRSTDPAAISLPQLAPRVQSSVIMPSACDAAARRANLPLHLTGAFVITNTA